MMSERQRCAEIARSMGREDIAKAILRPVRPYCLQPDNCVAESIRPCRVCQPDAHAAMVEPFTNPPLKYSIPIPQKLRRFVKKLERSGVKRVEIIAEIERFQAGK